MPAKNTASNSTRSRDEFAWWGNPIAHPNGLWTQPGRCWPKEVPVLSPRNIRQDGKLGTGDCRCLLGWVCGFSHGVYLQVEAMMMTVISVECDPTYETIDVFNDTSDRKLVAWVWNETMRRLGFTEPV